MREDNANQLFIEEVMKDIDDGRRVAVISPQRREVSKGTWMG